MRILLVNPPNSGRSIPEEEYGIANLKMIFRGEPLALEVLAGNLPEHEVAIADLKADPDSLDAMLTDFRPELVGVTGVTCEADAMIDIARRAKGAGGPVVVVGGHHASCDPGYFNREAIDFVVTGLGKASFRDLIDALSSGGDPGALPGVARTDPSGALSVTPRHHGFDDLVEDRPPRYDLVERYRESYAMSGVGGKMGFVVSAYGCTHRCLFCAIPNVTGGRYLPHRPETVIRDIRLLDGLSVIRLVDANTFGDVAAAEALGRKILDAGLNRRFVADVRSDTVVNHPDLFRLWREAGLETAVIGFEEFRDDRLKAMNKQSGVAVHEAAMTILKELGIRIVGDFIVSPEYTEADFDALQAFVDAHPIDVPLPAILTPIPGTPLYRRYRDAITVTDLAYYTFTNAVMPTRLPEADFYRIYARLWNHFVGHIGH